MRALILITLHLSAHEAAQEVNLECEEFHGFPPANNTSPSVLADLRVELVPEEDGYKVNISWAINIDGSTEYLTGTRVLIDGKDALHCHYHPPLVQADLTGLKQIWFYHMEKVSFGFLLIQAANLPLPFPPMKGDRSYRAEKITVPRTNQRADRTTSQSPAVVDGTTSHSFAQKTETQQSDSKFSRPVVATFLGLTCLMILSLCCIIYKNFKKSLPRSLGLEPSYTSPVVPIPVLMVYPAENPVFQQGVVALAELLQWHGGCSIAVDMWQQGKIAKLGPMRWLSEQVKAADIVLIVRPQIMNASLQSGKSTDSSIPAAAHDLYPLIINMVGSHAKSKIDLAKFWVVQLGGQQGRGLWNLEPELRACKLFCLTKDLIRICTSLQKHRKKNQRTPDLKCEMRVEKNAVKLRESIDNISKMQLGASSDSKTVLIAAI